MTVLECHRSHEHSNLHQISFEAPWNVCDQPTNENNPADLMDAMRDNINQERLELDEVLVWLRESQSISVGVYNGGRRG